MNQSKHLPNAPLVFVLAVIRISVYPNFVKRFSDVHESLLAEFPEQAIVNELNVHVGSSEPSVNQQKSFRIVDSDGSVSVLFREDVIAIEWAEYIDFEHAEKTIEIVLDALFENLPHLTVQHIGLRYVNAILESGDDRLESFVHQGLLGSPISGKLIGSACGSAVELDDSQRVSITLHRGDKSAGEVMLPPGIEFPPRLNPNRRMSLYSSHRGGFGLLDADGGVPMRARNEDKGLVMAGFRKLRDSMRPVFDSAVTAEAVSKWSAAK